MFEIKKNTVILIITAAVLVLLTVLTVVLLSIPKESGNESSVPDSSATSSTENHAFFDYAKEDIVSVEISNEHGVYTLVRVTEGETSRIALEGKESETLMSSTASSAFNGAATLKSNKLVSDDASKLSEYGLDDPSVTVKTTLKDGSVHTLYLGIESPAGGFYANTSESTDVYLITAFSASYFRSARTDYYPTDLLGAYDAAAFRGLTVSRPGEKDIDVIRLTDEEYEAAMDAAEANIKSQHELTSPFKYDVNSVYLQRVVEAVSGLNALETVTDDVSASSLASYGLDKPKTLLIKDDSKKLLIGSKSSTADVYYVMLDGRGVVYAASADSLSFIEDGADRYAYTMIGLVALKNVKSLVIETADKKYDFICNDFDDLQNLEVSCDGKELPPDEFKKLYQQIFSATQNGLAEKPSSDLYLRVTYNKRDGSKVVMEYYKIDITRYYAEVNGVGIFSVKADMVEKIAADCERIMNGEIITLV